MRFVLAFPNWLPTLLGGGRLFVVKAPSSLTDSGDQATATGRSALF